MSKDKHQLSGVTEAQPLRLPRSAVEAIAEVWSKEAEYSPNMSLVEMVERFNGTLIFSDDPRVLETNSIRVNGERDFEIRIPATATAAANRFTVAHELGHYVLHYLAANDRKPIFASRYGTGEAENEANWFAWAFLMPAEDFRRTWKDCQSSILSVAEYFKVSVFDSITRARQLGLVPAKLVIDEDATEEVVA
ncbi:ImmA/IrrE family metallo-endopeptidase [Asticcacaulis biprosthecium]|uniref:ImmA/IrrE family metallo-endopeptidase n=1 Tax=Asticcacaulis biprosthecium TaxID=76891 RepID=UPI001B7FE666|nr:ImmA/IrrE family metallo-endopeptidase [Asticcacaulis biprosthecium]